MASGGSAAVADNLTQNIRDQFLCCKICLDGLKLPKTLPCLHTFCADCIAVYIDHNRLDSRKFCCPICRRQIYIPKNGVAGFPDSFFVASLSDIVEQTSSDRLCGICKFKAHQVEAAVLCVECKTELCVTCGTSHNSAKVTEGHTLLPLDQESGVTRENYCRVHRGETIKYYCETCNSPICLPCTFLDHNGHEVEEIKDVRSSFSADMAELVIQGKDSIIQLTQAKSELAELENELFMRKDMNKTEIRRATQEVIQGIKEQEGRLIGQLDAFYDIVNVSRDRQKVERAVYSLERAQNFAEQLLSDETSPITQIVNKAEAKDSLEQALRYDLPDITVHGEKLDNYGHFIPGQLNVNLGTLIKCCTLDPHTLPHLHTSPPATRAVYLHALRSNITTHPTNTTPHPTNPSPHPTNLGEVFGMAFLPRGELAVLVNSPRKVRIFDRQGKMKFEFGENTELLQPSDMAVTREGRIAIADCGVNTIKVYDVFGNLYHSFGGPDMFQLPISLAVDNLGKFLVCDQLKQRVTIHRDSGELLRSVDITEVLNPQFISCLGNTVYICDSDNNVISLYNYRESLTFIMKISAGSLSDEDPQMLDCSGIAVDGCGNLVVSDLVMDRLHLINVQCKISQIIPTGRTVLRPMCVATSTDGLLAVAQQGVDTMIPDAEPATTVCVYRCVRADV